MTVTIAAFMPIAIPTTLAPIFTRVTMRGAIVFANGFTPTAILVADTRTALLTHYILLAHYILVVMPSLGADFIPVLRPSLDPRGLMLFAGLLANLGLSRTLFAALIMTRLLLMMRLGMRII